MNVLEKQLNISKPANYIFPKGENHMSLDSITDLITLLKDLFKSGNFKTILLFGIVLFFILLFKNLDPLQKSAVLLYNMKIQKNDLTKERNKKALQKLYLPLFQYVYPQTEISQYLPDQAYKFLRDIQSIINEHPLYSTDLLNDLMTQLGKKLNKKKNYQYTLSQIRFYIMYEYDLLRKELGYPTVNKKIRSTYINSPINYIYNSGYVATIICFLSCLVLLSVSFMDNISEIDAKLVVDIFFSYIFIISALTMIIIFIITVFIELLNFVNIRIIWKNYKPEEAITHSKPENNNPLTDSDISDSSK